jgi:RimJ/RimL family protein N-acetyltransferase
VVRATGSNLILRDWSEADLPVYREWLEPGHRWVETDAPYYPQFTADEADEHVASLLAREEAPSAIPTRLAIQMKEGGVFVGSVSRYWISIETQWLAAGIAIFDPDYWGKGVGREALGLWIDFLFEAMPDLVRLDLQTWSGNVGMIKLAQKLGFTEEARYRQARIVNGFYYDAIGYGILKSEWQVRS